MKVKIKNESPYQSPEYAHETDSGMDIRANLVEPLTLEPGERCGVPTGIYVELPENVEIQVRPRSGLALKKGLTVLNTPGTVDESYRGEIKVILINLDKNPQTIEPGERIAQLVFANVLRPDEIEVVNEISEDTDRGTTGFGDSGKF